ncbi:ryanodine-sensitive calcium-release channel [Aureococcus anophagefferens]|nr:ryanodine-sensitive calcium-release channel [Aureococcus anophagefferens]
MAGAGGQQQPLRCGDQVYLEISRGEATCRVHADVLKLGVTLNAGGDAGDFELDGRFAVYPAGRFAAQAEARAEPHEGSSVLHGDEVALTSASGPCSGRAPATTLALWPDWPARGGGGAASRPRRRSPSGRSRSRGPARSSTRSGRFLSADTRACREARRIFFDARAPRDLRPQLRRTGADKDVDATGRELWLLEAAPPLAAPAARRRSGACATSRRPGPRRAGAAADASFVLRHAATGAVFGERPRAAAADSDSDASDAAPASDDDAAPADLGFHAGPATQADAFQLCFAGNKANEFFFVEQEGGGWFLACIDQIAYSVGAAEALSQLVSDNEELLERHIDARVVDDFASLIEAQGPRADLLGFLGAICSCRGRGVKAATAAPPGPPVEWAATGAAPAAFLGAAELRSGFSRAYASWTCPADGGAWEPRTSHLFWGPGRAGVRRAGGKEDDAARDALCRDVVGCPYDEVYAAARGDEALRAGLARQKQLARYFVEQVRTLSEMVRTRSYKVARVVEKEWSYGLLVSSMVDARLPAAARAALVRLLHHLYLDRYPHEENCGKAQLPEQIVVVDPTSALYPQSDPALKDADATLRKSGYVDRRDSLNDDADFVAAERRAARRIRDFVAFPTSDKFHLVDAAAAALAATGGTRTTARPTTARCSTRSTRSCPSASARACPTSPRTRRRSSACSTRGARRRAPPDRGGRRGSLLLEPAPRSDLVDADGRLRGLDATIKMVRVLERSLDVLENWRARGDILRGLGQRRTLADDGDTAGAAGAAAPPPSPRAVEDVRDAADPSRRRPSLIRKFLEPEKQYELEDVLVDLMLTESDALAAATFRLAQRVRAQRAVLLRQSEDSYQVWTNGPAGAGSPFADAEALLREILAFAAVSGRNQKILFGLGVASILAELSGVDVTLGAATRAASARLRRLVELSYDALAALLRAAARVLGARAATLEHGDRCAVALRALGKRPAAWLRRLAVFADDSDDDDDDLVQASRSALAPLGAEGPVDAVGLRVHLEVIRALASAVTAQTCDAVRALVPADVAVERCRRCRRLARLPGTRDVGAGLCCAYAVLLLEILQAARVDAAGDLLRAYGACAAELALVDDDGAQPAGDGGVEDLVTLRREATTLLWDAVDGAGAAARATGRRGARATTRCSRTTPRPRSTPRRPARRRRAAGGLRGSWSRPGGGSWARPGGFAARGRRRRSADVAAPERHDPRHEATVLDAMETLATFLRFHAANHAASQLPADHGLTLSSPETLQPAACEVFDMIDTDGSGAITFEEIMDALQSNPYVFNFMNECGDERLASFCDPRTLASAFASIDGDGSNTISKKEWEAVVAEGVVGAGSPLARRAKRAWDASEAPKAQCVILLLAVSSVALALGGAGAGTRRAVDMGVLSRVARLLEAVNPRVVLVRRNVARTRLEAEQRALAAAGVASPTAVAAPQLDDRLRVGALGLGALLLFGGVEATRRRYLENLRGTDPEGYFFQYTAVDLLLGTVSDRGELMGAMASQEGLNRRSFDLFAAAARLLDALVAGDAAGDLPARELAPAAVFDLHRVVDLRRDDDVGDSRRPETALDDGFAPEPPPSPRPGAGESYRGDAAAGGGLFRCVDAEGFAAEPLGAAPSKWARLRRHYHESFAVKGGVVKNWARKPNNPWRRLREHVGRSFVVQKGVLNHWSRAAEDRREASFLGDVRKAGRRARDNLRELGAMGGNFAALLPLDLHMGRGALDGRVQELFSIRLVVRGECTLSTALLAPPKDRGERRARQRALASLRSSLLTSEVSFRGGCRVVVYTAPPYAGGGGDELVRALVEEHRGLTVAARVGAVVRQAALLAHAMAMTWRLTSRSAAYRWVQRRERPLKWSIYALSFVLFGTSSLANDRSHRIAEKAGEGEWRAAAYQRARMGLLEATSGEPGDDRGDDGAAPRLRRLLFEDNALARGLRESRRWDRDHGAWLPLLALGLVLALATAGFSATLRGRRARRGGPRAAAPRAPALVREDRLEDAFWYCTAYDFATASEEIVGHALLLAVVACGVFASCDCFGLLLLEIVLLSSSLRNVTRAILRPFNELLVATYLMCVVCLVFTVVGLLAFQSLRGDDHYCKTVKECLFLNVYHGIVNGELVSVTKHVTNDAATDYHDLLMPSNAELKRMLLQLVFNIVLDFAEHQALFSMRNYVHFVGYLAAKDPSIDSPVEAYVRAKNADADFSWIPLGTCFSLEKSKRMRASKSENEVARLHDRLDAIAADQERRHAAALEKVDDLAAAVCRDPEAREDRNSTTLRVLDVLAKTFDESNEAHVAWTPKMLAIMTMSLTKLFARGREATTIRHGIVRQVVECADEFDGRGAANVCGALGKCVSVFDVASSAPLFEALAPRIVDLLPEIVESKFAARDLSEIAWGVFKHAPVDVATELVYLVGCEVSHRLNMGVPCLAQAVQEASMLAYAIGTVITRGGSHLAKLGLDWTESARGVLDLADDVALDPRNDRDVRPETYRLLALGFGGAQGVRVSRAQESVSQVLRECGFAHEMEVDLDGTGLTADAADVDARVAVEYDGPRYLADRTQTGRTRFKHRLVRALGWRLVVVSHYGWEQASDKRAYAEDLLAPVGRRGRGRREPVDQQPSHAASGPTTRTEEPATDDEGNPEDGASSAKSGGGKGGGGGGATAARRGGDEALLRKRLQAKERTIEQLQARLCDVQAAADLDLTAPARVAAAEAAAADPLAPPPPTPRAAEAARAAAEAAAAEAGRIIEAQKVELEDASAGAASAGALDALRAAAEATATDLCHTVAAQKTELEAAAGTVRKLTDISADISSRLRRAEVEREEASARLDDLSVRLRDVERERDDKLAQLSRTLARTEAEHDKEKQRHEETKLKLREKCELITLRAKADVDARVAALERERLAQVSIPETTPDAPARAPATASDLANSRGGTCVARVLDTLGLSGKLADKFAEEEIDDRAFGDLEAKEFEEVGASPEEARRIIECRDALVVAFPPADARGAMASPAPMKQNHGGQAQGFL